MTGLTASSNRRQSPLWLTFLSIFAFAILAAWVIYLSITNDQNEKLRNSHTVALNSANALFSSELGNIRHTAALSAARLTDILELSDSISLNQALERVGQDIPLISQIRWLAFDGREIARINYIEGQPHVVPQDQLQIKNTRYYVSESRKALDQTIYLSPIDLNREFGEIVVPYEPTIRAIKRMTLPGNDREGLFVINIPLTALLTQITELNTEHTTLRVSGGDSKWVLHPDKAKLFTSDRGLPASGLATDYPDVFEAVAMQETGSLITAHSDDVLSVLPLAYNLRADGNFNGIYIVAFTPASHHNEMAGKALVPAAATATVILLIGLLFLWRENLARSAQFRLSKRLEQERNELVEVLATKEQLQQELTHAEKMASLGLLVAGISHEVNTPLGGVIMAVSGIESRLIKFRSQVEQGLTRSELDDFMNYVEQSVESSNRNLNRAKDIVNRFKRIAIDRGSVEPEKFDPHGVISDVVKALSHKLNQHGVAIKFDSVPLGTYMGYPGLLSQITQNLIVNCIDHAFENIKHPEIIITLYQNGNKLCLTVEDNGVGIPEAMKKVLFEPFATSRRSKGNSGLGLYLVKQWLNQSLKGEISVKARATGGTSFTLEMSATSV